MLEAWQSATGPDRLVPAVADAIATPKASTEAKLAGLRFISSVVEGGQAGKCLDAVVRAAAVGLQDKAVDPREAGAGVIQQVLAVGARLSAQGSRLASTCHQQGRSHAHCLHMVRWLCQAASAGHLRGIVSLPNVPGCLYTSMSCQPVRAGLSRCCALFVQDTWLPLLAVWCHRSMWTESEMLCKTNSYLRRMTSGRCRPLWLRPLTCLAMRFFW